MSRTLTSSWPFLLLLLAALSPAALACGGRPPADTLSEPDASEIDVHVISHNFQDAVVYLYIGESRQRMGMAGGKQTTMFTIPWRRVAGSAVRLRAELIGSEGEVLTEILQLQPGARVVWTLEPHIAGSSVTVY